MGCRADVRRIGDLQIPPKYWQSGCNNTAESHHDVVCLEKDLKWRSVCAAEEDVRRIRAAKQAPSGVLRAVAAAPFSFIRRKPPVPQPAAGLPAASGSHLPLFLGGEGSPLLPPSPFPRAADLTIAL